MNIPKLIQEAVFLAVCKAQAGNGVEQPWDSESFASTAFNAKGQLLRKGTVALSVPGAGQLEIPFTAIYTFGKPRRSKADTVRK